MPKFSTRPPKYGLHKPSGQAIVNFGGKVRYLGPHGSPESKAAYLKQRLPNGAGRRIPSHPRHPPRLPWSIS